jgi:hypothetical protein
MVDDEKHVGTKPPAHRAIEELKSMGTIVLSVGRRHITSVVSTYVVRLKPGQTTIVPIKSIELMIVLLD